MLHEPLSYNTAGFLFSCLNTFYTLSVKTRLNNLERNAREEKPEKTKTISATERFKTAANHTSLPVPLCES